MDLALAIICERHVYPSRGSLGSDSLCRTRQAHLGNLVYRQTTRSSRGCSVNVKMNDCKAEKSSSVRAFNRYMVGKLGYIVAIWGGEADGLSIREWQFGPVGEGGRSTLGPSPATSLGLGAQEWPRPLKTGVAVPARGPSAVRGGRPREPGFRVQPAYRIIMYRIRTLSTGEVFRDGRGGMVRRFCAVGSVLSGGDG